MFDKIKMTKALVEIAERTGHEDYVKALREHADKPEIAEHFGAGLSDDELAMEIWRIQNK